MKNEVLEFGLYHNSTEYHDRQVKIWVCYWLNIDQRRAPYEVLLDKYSHSVSAWTEQTLDEYSNIFTYYLDIILDNINAFV